MIASSAAGTDALVGLRKLAALTGAALINLDSQSGMLGGDPANHRDQLTQQVLETLESIGVDKQTRKQVASAARNRDIGDYVFSIQGHAVDCVLPPARQIEWLKDMQYVEKGWPPSADAIQKLLDKYDVHDEFTGKAVDEYRYYIYMETGEHRDAQFWRDRDSWPTSPSTNQNDPHRCPG
jgi:hypothetical protein